MFPIYRNQTYTHTCTITHNIKTEERLSGGGGRKGQEGGGEGSWDGGGGSVLASYNDTT